VTEDKPGLGDKLIISTVLRAVVSAVVYKNAPGVVVVRVIPVVCYSLKYTAVVSAVFI